MTPAEIAKLLADYQAGHAIGLYDKIDDLARLALDQATEVARLQSALSHYVSEVARKVDKLAAKDARIAEVTKDLAEAVRCALMRRDQLDVVEAQIAELKAALREIARQKKTDELETEYDVECADFEGGYDACIDRARAALKEQPE